MVGSALFRDSFVRSTGRGHVDLDRLQRAGVRVVGLTVATAWPDPGGSLSRWHFRSLGVPRPVLRSRLATAEWVIDRIDRWCAESEGRLRVIRSREDLDECLAPGGAAGMLVGIQGGHALDGDVANVERLFERGVRMFAPAHVMDNALVGSGTGRVAGGLTSFGREVVAALEEQRVVVDVAHMSLPGIRDTLEVATRSVVVSHTGLTEVAGRRSRRRRFSAATRNIPAAVAGEIGRSGGLVGVALAAELVGGSSLSDVVRTVRAALDAAGEQAVAIGSDMDGALRTVIDVEGLPALAGALSDAGLAQSVVDGVMGGNAVRFLRAALP